jgi:hypothetical protein
VLAYDASYQADRISCSCPNKIWAIRSGRSRQAGNSTDMGILEINNKILLGRLNREEI